MDKVFTISHEIIFHLPIKNDEKVQLSVVNREEADFILYTSGAAGQPKGKILSLRHPLRSWIELRNIFDTGCSIKQLLGYPHWNKGRVIKQTYGREH